MGHDSVARIFTKADSPYDHEAKATCGEVNKAQLPFILRSWFPQYWFGSETYGQTGVTAPRLLS